MNKAESRLPRSEFQNNADRDPLATKYEHATFQFKIPH